MKPLIIAFVCMTLMSLLRYVASGKVTEPDTPWVVIHGLSILVAFVFGLIGIFFLSVYLFVKLGEFVQVMEAAGLSTFWSSGLVLSTTVAWGCVSINNKLQKQYPDRDREKNFCNHMALTAGIVALVCCAILIYSIAQNMTGK